MDINLTSGTLLSRFSRLAIANIIANLMVPLAGIIDTAFLGHLAEIHHLGGVALATVIFNVVYWSFGFLRMGTTGLTAQAQGRRDGPLGRSLGHRTDLYFDVYLVLVRNGLVALAIGFALLLLQEPIRVVGFGLLGGDADLRQAGEAFYYGRIWGSPAVLLNFVILGWMLGLGQGRRVIVLSVVANGSNIILDYWFIQRLGWASGGAGVATSLSQYLMLGVGMIYLGRSLPWREWRTLGQDLWQPEALGIMVRLNRDILIRTFVLVMSFALFTHWSATLGTTVLAANALMLQVFTLTSYVVDGIAFATESFAGQFWGAQDYQQLRRLLEMGGGFSLVVGLGFALGFALWPRSLFGLMTDHEAVLVTVEQYGWWLVPVLGLGAIAFMLDGYFLGLTAGKWLRLSTVLATLVGFLPLALLGRWWHSPPLLWLALVGLMLVRSLILASRVPSTLTQHPEVTLG
ncbi:MATE family efflux transporter [Leptolyngbya sp. PCC 6406]|uniref:MATE family efflux transporter n=1 Tax=Leptolyngbya sp. PCC 6406 TaxID=1173264 RepID=UPI0002ACC911|nr:MATE family efflux transporter [Leptolyngbya sp. PCC 6406]